jgi:hypothetical protein
MSYLAQISFDDVLCSVLACIAIRQAMIVALPDRVAGPGGWLIDTAGE